MNASLSKVIRKSAMFFDCLIGMGKGALLLFCLPIGWVFIGILIFGETLLERCYRLVFLFELFLKAMQGTLHLPFERIVGLSEFLKVGRLILKRLDGFLEIFNRWVLVIFQDHAANIQRVQQS